MSTYKRTHLESVMSPMEAQNYLHQLTTSSLAAGLKVIRIMTSVTDNALRTRRVIQEVRVCAVE